MDKLATAGAAALVFAWAGLAFADPAPRLLRVIGQAPAAKDPAPAGFVIDATIKPGDGLLQGEVEGWFSALPPAAGSGEIRGTCADSRCALSVDLEDGKLAITGDLAGPGAPGAGRMVFKSEDDDQEHAEGAVSFTPVAGPIEGLGALAAPDAVSGRQLVELLLWNGSSDGFGDTGDDPPDDSQREALADWQGANGRAATGLILEADLQELRDKTDAAKTAAGWTMIGDEAHGWSAGYPAALLTKASRNGRERRFESADGKAAMVLAIDPPLDEDAFDAVWEKTKAGQEGREGIGYTRVNGQFEISWKQKGVVTRTVYRNLEGALARLVYSYPDGDETYEPFAAILPQSLRLTDALKPE